MIVVPVGIEDALYAATPAIGEAALAKAIVDRSKRYTSDRDRLATPTDRVGDLAARALFFTITDAMKIAIPIDELLRRGGLPEGSLKVVDLGAGCGAMSLGLTASLPVAPAIIAIDRDADALRIAAKAVGTFATITTRADDATRCAIPACDLVVMGTMLNELAPDAALAVMRRALAAAPTVIAIEPALRETSRALHAIRDALVPSEAHVFAPCTRQGPCPALIDPDDWCHEDRAVTLPPRTRVLAQRTHLRDGGMRFSYVVLRRSPLALVEEPGAWRIVSAPHVEKGKREVFGCSDRGRVKLRLLKRHRAASNRDFEAADRGDVLTFEPPLDGNDVIDHLVRRKP